MASTVSAPASGILLLFYTCSLSYSIIDSQSRAQEFLEKLAPAIAPKVETVPVSSSVEITNTVVKRPIEDGSFHLLYSFHMVSDLNFLSTASCELQEEANCT